MPGHHPRRIAPFGHLRITGCTRLPAACRSVPRPSSAVGAKASTTCAYYLAPHRHTTLPGTAPARKPLRAPDASRLPLPGHPATRRTLHHYHLHLLKYCRPRRARIGEGRLRRSYTIPDPPRTVHPQRAYRKRTRAPANRWSVACCARAARPARWRSVAWWTNDRPWKAGGEPWGWIPRGGPGSAP
jgi:hypothetical protein